MGTRMLRGLAFVAIVLAVSSCGPVRYVKSELAGDAKPDGGVTEAVAPTRSYRASPSAIRAAVLSVLAEQGYITEENPAAGSIKTEPRALSDGGSTLMVKYSARVYVTLAGPDVTYRARFDKISAVVQPESNQEYPEKEQELRKQFFEALDKKLPAGNAPASSTATPNPAPAPPMTGTAPSSSSAAAGVAPATGPMSIAEMQRILATLGYQPGAADGVAGKRTVDALKQFQQANQLPATGKLNAETAAKLRSAQKSK